MKIYNCDVCHSLIYFENTICMNCQSQLGYLPVLDNMSSLEQIDQITWKALAPQANGAIYKKCQNYQKENICNWMIPQEVNHEYCLACQFNEVIPDLNISENRTYWQRIEVAKRRLIYSLLRFGLPLITKEQDAHRGLAFYFLAEDKNSPIKEYKKVNTGHDTGKITINVAEADSVKKEKMKKDMGEGYRTLLGHFRHEIGHYYWFLLIENNSDVLEQFRNIFGNEQLDYGKSLKRYYAEGPPSNWQDHFVSKYASSHPWEDWAESWAHYLHMIDTLETASAWGLTIGLKKNDSEKSMYTQHNLQTFEEMRDQWVCLSCALNSLNRSMGMSDVYPFVWSEAVIEKLRFVQQVIIKFKQEVKE